MGKPDEALRALGDFPLACGVDTSIGKDASRIRSRITRRFYHGLRHEHVDWQGRVAKQIPDHSAIFPRPAAWTRRLAWTRRQSDPWITRRFFHGLRHGHVDWHGRVANQIPDHSAIFPRPAAWTRRLARTRRESDPGSLGDFSSACGMDTSIGKDASRIKSRITRRFFHGLRHGHVDWHGRVANQIPGSLGDFSTACGMNSSIGKDASRSRSRITRRFFHGLRHEHVDWHGRVANQIPDHSAIFPRPAAWTRRLARDASRIRSRITRRFFHGLRHEHVDWHGRVANQIQGSLGDFSTACGMDTSIGMDASLIRSLDHSAIFPRPAAWTRRLARTRRESDPWITRRFFHGLRHGHVDWQGRVANQIPDHSAIFPRPAA